MASLSSLVISAGSQRQILAEDTLLVGVGIDPTAAGALSIGVATATSIVIGAGGITTSFPGPVELLGGITTVGGTTFTTDAVFEGNVTFGNADTDTVSFTSQIATEMTYDGIGAPALSPAGHGRIYFDSGSNTFMVSEDGGAYFDLTAAPGGSDGSVQFNDDGILGGDASLTYDSATFILSLKGISQAEGAVSLSANGASSFTTSAGALTLTAAAASTWSTAAGDLSLTAAAGSVIIDGAEAAADAVRIVSSGGAGGIDIDSGSAGITLDSTGTFSIDSAWGASNVSATFGDLTLSTITNGHVNITSAWSVLVAASGENPNAIELATAAGGMQLSAGQDITIVSAETLTLNGVGNCSWQAESGNLTLATATSGDVIVNTPSANNALVVKATTGKVGLGTASPTQLLSVGAASEFAVSSDGVLKSYDGAAPTDGQLLIGDTAGEAFVAATLTAGAGLSVTNGAGTITIASTGEAAAAAVDITTTAMEALAAGDLVCFINDGGVPRVQPSDSNDVARQGPVGFAVAAAAAQGDAVLVRIAGEAAVPAARFDAAPAASDVGKRVFLSVTPGKVTLTAPTANGDVVQRVGILTNGSGNPKILVQVGESITL